MRCNDVAQLAGVRVAEVHSITAGDMRDLCEGKIDQAVINIMMQEPASYWRVGDKFYFDDPYFGAVVCVDGLAYNRELGLHVRRGE